MNAATGASGGDSPANEQALRFAMLSIYYDCLGREGSSGGAPAILLPLPGGPVSLADALTEVQKGGRDAMRAAAWRIVRATPAGGPYPGALARALTEMDSSLELSVLDDLRTQYGAGANLLGAALVACAENQPEFDALRKHLSSVKTDLDKATQAVLGMTASDFLSGTDPAKTSTELRLLREQVGLDLYRYAIEFADAVAFAEWWGAADPKPDPGTGEMTVYPAASVIQQDLRSMITQVTVTALARCDSFSTLKVSSDPQYWSRASKVLAETRYVDGCYDLTPTQPRIAPGQGYEHPAPPPHRWLEEKVNVPSGLDSQSDGSFHNVLRVDKFNVVDEQAVTVKFSLARCIDSTVLWDTRSGGILVDQGYILVRRLTQDCWRLTSHKTLLFSNRTPNMSATGWFDMGQMLNVLCPAALSWWLESEIYSVADPKYSDRSNGASDGAPE